MESRFKALSGSISTLIGVGRSNIALAKYLTDEGGKVYLCDNTRPENELNKVIEENQISNCHVIQYGTAPKADFVFRTPVIRPDAEILQSFVNQGAVLASEIELFFEKCKAKIIGITGSDGKTTTATLTAEMYKKAFERTSRKVYLGGNIGIPLISFLNQINSDDIIIAELSSFQLMTSKASPNISAVTNISKNHLDWHTDMNEYVCSKANIFKSSECNKLITDRSAFEYFKRLSITLPPKTEIIGTKNCVYCAGNSVYIHGEKLIDTSEILIKGKHNLNNFMMSSALSYPEVTLEHIYKVGKEFRGVPHRIEFVRNCNGISYYNSSIDSTPTRTINTLQCFQGDLTLICGGYDKNLDYTELAEYINANVIKTVIYGAAADKIYESFKKLDNICTKVIIEYDFDKAFFKASEITKKGGTVLLSPACASFDQFKDFEQRGERFSKLVNLQ